MPSADVKKIDLVKQHKDEYATPKEPRLIEVGSASYVAVEGAGKPGGTDFQSKVGDLYAMAYTLKFQSKASGPDFVVCKLEGLWGVGQPPGSDLSAITPESWRWKLLIRIPTFLKEKDLVRARSTLRDKGKEGNFEGVRLDVYEEGRCVQMLHLGPYEEEGRTLEQMRAFMEENGLTPRLVHHEIYLSDPRRVQPEKLKTLLRQPVE